MKTFLVFVSLFYSIFALLCEEGGYTLQSDTKTGKYFVHDIIPFKTCNAVTGCFSEFTYHTGEYMTLYHGCADKDDLNELCDPYIYSNDDNWHTFCCQTEMCTSFDKELGGTSLLESTKAREEENIINALKKYYAANAARKEEKEAEARYGRQQGILDEIESRHSMAKVTEDAAANYVAEEDPENPPLNDNSTKDETTTLPPLTF